MLLRADQLWLLNVIYPPRKKTQFHVFEKIKGQRTKSSRQEDENEIESAVGTPLCFTLVLQYLQGLPQEPSPLSFMFAPGMAVRWDVYTRPAKENTYLNLQLWWVD